MRFLLGSAPTWGQNATGTMTTTAPAGSQLFTEADMAEGTATRFCGGHAVVFSQRCPGMERPNEDAAALIPFSGDGGLLIVADGVGGHKAGAQASGLAISLVATSVRRARREGTDLRNAVLNGVEAANHAIAGLGVGAGTTLAIVEIAGRSVRSFHVGDSMILTVGQRGRVKMQTVPHSPTGYAVEAGLLDAHEALHHEERHLVSNMLGTPDMRVEMGSTMRLADRDTVVLASDGLSDNLTEEEIVEMVRKGPLERAARRLAVTARTRMEREGEGQGPSKPDDLTFVLFRLSALRASRKPTCPPAPPMV